VDEVHSPQGATLRFRVLDAVLPPPPPPRDRAPRTLAGPRTRVLRVCGLIGPHTLQVDGKAMATATAAEWAAGVNLERGPEFDQAEQLRQAIIAKNRLYFHRWRPENETYLFGFRKNEQGRNAKEIPEFDPLVTKAEGEVARLRAPVAHTYVLAPMP
jgi:hypothetical protein